jgi:glyoxylase-like metal-dependent hydrolase (beta-lactamase superfamily II)
MANLSTAPGDVVADGVGRIPGFVNSYTFVEGEDVLLIDTGFARKAKPIVRAFQDARVPLSRARKILLTHHHLDHTGGAAYLLQNTPALAACHAEDVPFVEGRRKAPIPLLMRLFVRVHPAPVATILQNGDQVGTLQVVHAPGHTPGEVVFYEPSRKILFSGDAVVERSGRLTLPAPRYATNLAQAVESLEKVRDLHPEVLLPGHGLPVTRSVDSLLDDLIRRAPTEFPSRT